MADIKTKYKRYNDTSKDFDTIYFKTTADQVLNVTDGKENGDWKGVLSNKYLINGKHWAAPAGSSTSGIVLTGKDIKWSDAGATTFTIYAKLTAMDITASDLDTRLKKIEGAYTSGDIITTANMDTKIKKVATIESGVWNGSAIEDAYIASATKWNKYEKSKQNTLTFDSEPTENSANPVTSKGIKTYVDNKVATVTAVAQGKTNTFVIDASAITAGAENEEFKVLKTTDKKTVTIPNTPLNKYITDVSGNNIKFEDMKVGDIILTTGEGIKDWFLGAITRPSAAIGSTDMGSFVFYQIDSDTPDLTVYALKSSLGDAASKTVSKTGPSANGADLVTEAQVKSFVEGKGYITSYTDTTYTFAEGTTNGAFTVAPKGGTAKSVKVHGLAAAAYKGVDTAAFGTTSTSANVPTTAAVAGTIAKRSTKIFYGATQPTDMVDGDIWIDTNN